MPCVSKGGGEEGMPYRSLQFVVLAVGEELAKGVELRPEHRLVEGVLAVSHGVEVRLGDRGLELALALADGEHVARPSELLDVVERIPHRVAASRFRMWVRGGGARERRTERKR